MSYGLNKKKSSILTLSATNCKYCKKEQIIYLDIGILRWRRMLFQFSRTVELSTR